MMIKLGNTDNIAAAMVCFHTQHNMGMSYEPTNIRSMVKGQAKRDEAKHGPRQIKTSITDIAVKDIPLP